MSRALVARLLLLVCMTWSLVLAPVAHALNMAAMAAPEQKAVSHCHQADTEQQPVNDCCCHKGTVCHCAVPVALPGSMPLSIANHLAIYPVVIESFLLHNLPPPEPPPPRQI